MKTSRGVLSIGAAGQFLDELLASINLKRAGVYIANVIKCRPPENRDPPPDRDRQLPEMADRQIELISPKIIVTPWKVFNGQVLPGEDDQ